MEINAPKFFLNLFSRGMQSQNKQLNGGSYYLPEMSDINVRTKLANSLSFILLLYQRMHLEQLIKTKNRRKTHFQL